MRCRAFLCRALKSERLLFSRGLLLDRTQSQVSLRLVAPPLLKEIEKVLTNPRSTDSSDLLEVADVLDKFSGSQKKTQEANGDRVCYVVYDRDRMLPVLTESLSSPRSAAPLVALCVFTLSRSPYIPCTPVLCHLAAPRVFPVPTPRVWGSKIIPPIIFPCPPDRETLLKDGDTFMRGYFF